ncbi:MAG: class I SAM-dependent methyltransferase [Planctomycetota bacterium]
MKDRCPYERHTGGYMAGRVAEMYDLDQRYAKLEDVPFYVDEAVRSGGPVLELGCGAGRVLLPIAREGVDVVGVDVTPTMLDVLRRKLRAEPPRVRDRVELVHHDMAEVRLGRRFPLVTMPFRVMQHMVTVERQLHALATVAEHLAEGGRFAFDVFNPDPRMLVLEEAETEKEDFPWTELDDGSRIRRTSRVLKIDHARQVADSQVNYFHQSPDGTVEEHVQRFPHRYFFRWEIEHLLARAGFEIEHLYSDFQRHPFGETFPGEIVVVARLSAECGVRNGES